MGEVNDVTLTIITVLLLGAGNSIYHAERLLPEDVEMSEFRKVVDPLKIILLPLIIVFSYLLIRQNFWLFLLSLVLNVAPINALTVMLSNLFVIPLVWVMAKLRGVKL